MATPDRSKSVHFFGLTIVAEPSAFGMSAVLFALFASLRIARGDTILGGFAFGLGAVLVHILALLGHHLGHATAARLTGYPMSGVVAKDLIWRSTYPPDEPTLPARLHAFRALGGPAASLILTGLSAAAWMAVGAGDDRLSRLLLLALLDNGLVFTLGSFLPLGFTDGSTLLNLIRWGQPER